MKIEVAHSSNIPVRWHAGGLSSIFRQVVFTKGIISHYWQLVVLSRVIFAKFWQVAIGSCKGADSSYNLIFVYHYESDPYVGGLTECGHSTGPRRCRIYSDRQLVNKLPLRIEINPDYPEQACPSWFVCETSKHPKLFICTHLCLVIPRA